MSGGQQKFHPRNGSSRNKSAFSNGLRDSLRAATPRAPALSDDKLPRGRDQTGRQPASSKETPVGNAPPNNPDAVTILLDKGGLSSGEQGRPNKRRRRSESIQARRYRESATRARLPPRKVPPLQVRRIAINKKVVRLTRKLQDADRSDRSSKDINRWCTERSNASIEVTRFIGKYYLDMSLIRSSERLKLCQACVNCLQLYSGNHPTFDVADAMWRTLRALELDLEMAKACGIDTLFKHWHDKKIYCHHVQEIAMEVEKRLMDMRCALVEDGEN